VIAKTVTRRVPYGMTEEKDIVCQPCAIWLDCNAARHMLSIASKGMWHHYWRPLDEVSEPFQHQANGRSLERLVVDTSAQRKRACPEDSPVYSPIARIVPAKNR